MKQFLKQVAVCLSLLLLTLSIFPKSILAVGYGEGSYGEGVYNVGEPSPTPASNPGSGSSDNNSGSSSSGTSGTPSCNNQKPTSTPDLFQINASSESVTLYFAPSNGNRDRYVVEYGTEDNKAAYAFEFLNDSTGVVAVDVNALQQYTTYYFKVRAGNGCMPGDWSNELSITTGQRWPSYRWAAASKIVTTAVRQVAKPSSITKVDQESITTSPTPSSDSAQQDTSTPPAGGSQPTQQPTSQPEQSSPGFFQKIGNFIKGLFGK